MKNYFILLSIPNWLNVRKWNWRKVKGRKWRMYEKRKCAIICYSAFEGSRQLDCLVRVWGYGKFNAPKCLAFDIGVDKGRMNNKTEKKEKSNENCISNVAVNWSTKIIMQEIETFNLFLCCVRFSAWNWIMMLFFCVNRYANNHVWAPAG